MAVEEIIEILRSKQKEVECLDSGLYSNAVEESDFYEIAAEIVRLHDRTCVKLNP